jgi:hypothetical protein
MKNKNTLEAVQDEITYLPAPEGVDMDVVGEIIGDDNWDIIFTENGIVCSNEQVDSVKEAYEQALEESEDEE